MKKLLVVEDAFDVKGRGLIVAPHLPLSELPSFREVDAELRYEDGSTRSVRARMEPVFQTPPAPTPRFVIVFPSLGKADVPLGAEVWCIVEPPSEEELLAHFTTDALEEPWRLVTPPEARTLEQELSRELVRGHALYERVVQAIARRIDSDDVLFLVRSPTAALAAVHLTWQRETDARWPRTRLFESAKDWIEMARAQID